MERTKNLLNIKFSFIGLNILLTIGSVFSFIYGMFDFDDKFVLSGSYLGGHLAQLSLFLLLLAVLGIYSVLRPDRIALVVYACIIFSSLFIRNFSAGLASFHGYAWASNGTGDVYWGLQTWFELFSLTISSYLIVSDK